jgi:hypothetical protein
MFIQTVEASVYDVTIEWDLRASLLQAKVFTIDMSNPRGNTDQKLWDAYKLPEWKVTMEVLIFFPGLR